LPGALLFTVASAWTDVRAAKPPTGTGTLAAVALLRGCIRSGTLYSDDALFRECPDIGDPDAPISWTVLGTAAEARVRPAANLK
jgi:hypothetical protein